MARNEEAKIQAAIVQWCGSVAPECLIFAVPNGGLRSKSEAALFKWTGVVAGIPDLIVLVPGGRALFLEVKTETGVVSDVQRQMMMTMQSLGFQTAVVRSIEDTTKAFAAWGISTREAPAPRQATFPQFERDAVQSHG